jgi:hypothetical protein
MERRKEGGRGSGDGDVAAANNAGPRDLTPRVSFFQPIGEVQTYEARK